MDSPRTDHFKVAIVDDHEVVRVGLKALLEDYPEFAVVGEASSATEAIEMALATSPDVIIMDIRLPDASGIDACRAIRSAMPSVRVLMLTSYADDEAILSSIIAGASGYILKQVRSQALVEAIRTVATGGSLLDPSVTEKVLKELRNFAAGKDARGLLSPQESRIAELVAEGKSNREIASQLGLAEGTVKNYVSAILAKLNLSRRSQLAAKLARQWPFPT
jgi:two-component system response regulator DevR